MSKPSERIVIRGLRILALGALIALAYVASPASAGAQELTAGMALSIEGPGVSCDGDGCTVPLNGDFTLSIETDGPPAGGYIGIQTQLYYGRLTYHPTETPAEENVWPDISSIVVRFPPEPTGNEQYVQHGGLTGVSPPFRESTFEGALVELSMSCTAQNATIPVALLSYNSDPSAGLYNVLGSTYSAPDQRTIPVNIIGQIDLDPPNEPPPELQSSGLANVSALLEITCGAGGQIEEPPLVTARPTTPPTDTPQPQERTATAEVQAAAANTQIAEATNVQETATALGTPAPTEIGGGAVTPDEDGEAAGDDDDGGGNTGLWIVIGVVVALALAGAGVVGWRYYQQRQGPGDAGPPAGGAPPESGAGTPEGGSSPEGGAGASGGGPSEPDG